MLTGSSEVCSCPLSTPNPPQMRRWLSWCCWVFANASALLPQSLCSLCFAGYGKGDTVHAGRAAPKLQSRAGGASSWQGFQTKGAKKTSAPLNIKSKPRTSLKPGPSKAGKGLKSQTKACKQLKSQRKQS